jgi:hypothetical protein
MDNQNLLNICNTMRQIENAKAARKSSILLNFIRAQAKAYLMIWSTTRNF